MPTRRDTLRYGSLLAGGLPLVGTAAGREEDRGRGREEHGRDRGWGRRDSADSFVQREGSQLVLDGRAFYFNGTNDFWLSDLWTTEDQVTRFFEAAAEQGIDVVRTWLFSAEPDRASEETHQLQPTAEHIHNGTISEAGGEYYDHVIDQAAKHDVRLVFTLTNYWGDYGGMQAYLEHSDTAPEEYDTPDFYTDPDAQQYYREFVETMLTRENTITETTYSEDPTIFMWELANEPRAPQVENGVEVLGNWIAEASAHVKDLDDNHLVTTGSEGFYADNPTGVYTRQGWENQSFVEHHRIDTIDVASFHLYPSSWGKEDAEQYGTEWIREHVQDAREEIEKPVFLGEFGIEVERTEVGGADPEAMERRNEIYRAWYDALEELDADGALLWQFTLEERLQYNDGHYVVESDEETLEIIRRYGRRADLKSLIPAHADRKRRAARLRAFGDYEAPPAPGNLEATGVRATEADVTWDAVEDDETGLAYYQAYVDGEPTAAFHPDDTSGTVWGLEPDATQQIALTAIDNVDNESARSELEVTTPAE